MTWILIVASVCYPSAVLVAGFSHTAESGMLTLPPAASINVLRFATRDALEAHVASRIVWGRCVETLAAVSPDGKSFRISKHRKVRRVVREVEESDGFSVAWEEVKP